MARRELRAGERLIWADRLAPGVVSKRHMVQFLFAVPFTAFACFWIWGASRGFGQSAMTTIFPFFGLPFLAVGVWMLLTPLRAGRKAQSTVYAITDQRLFIASGDRTRSVQSFAPGDITKVERHDHGDGLGDVIFAEEVSWRSARSRMGWRTNDNHHVEDIGFFGVREAREVEAEVVRLRQSTRAASGVVA